MTRQHHFPKAIPSLPKVARLLRLVGIMLLGVRSSGGVQGQLGHLLLVLLLDFPVPLHRKGPPLLGAKVGWEDGDDL